MMRLMLKIAIALVVLMAAGIAHADVPDVSTWSCPNINVGSYQNYSVEITTCDNSNPSNFYIKVSGELVYVHEHRMDDGKTVYYNALKNNKGNWIETVNTSDLTYRKTKIENRGVIMSITDDNGIVIAERTTPRLKQ